jgi:lactate dehydrogenase-like 2-hydroxyacid dehydrogenase
MKKGVVIVNTARGAVMDEAALVVALEKGQVWSCGLDVFEEEPKVHSGLVRIISIIPSHVCTSQDFLRTHTGASIFSALWNLSISDDANSCTDRQSPCNARSSHGNVDG